MQGQKDFNTKTFLSDSRKGKFSQSYTQKKHCPTPLPALIEIHLSSGHCFNLDPGGQYMPCGSGLATL